MKASILLVALIVCFATAEESKTLKNKFMDFIEDHTFTKE